MASDSLRDSINRILQEKNKQRSNSQSSGAIRRGLPPRLYFRLLFKKVVGRLLSLKLLRLLIVLVVLVIVILRNTESLYYKSLEAFDPIVISKNYKLFNSGIDSCYKLQFLSYDDEKSEHKYSFTKSRVLHMDPNHEVLTYQYVSLSHNTKQSSDDAKDLLNLAKSDFGNAKSHTTSNLTLHKKDGQDEFKLNPAIREQATNGSILIATTLLSGRSTIKNFKSIFNKVNRLTLDKPKVTLAIMLKSASKDDNSIESFVDNYFKSDYDGKLKFSKIVLIYHYQNLNEQKLRFLNHKTQPQGQKSPPRGQELFIANFDNLLINTALVKEKSIIYLPNWNDFNFESINSIEEFFSPDYHHPGRFTSKDILIGFSKKNDGAGHHHSSKSDTVIEYVTIRSALFKQGIQFNSILLKGNSWSHKGIIKTKNEEIENLCYQAEAIGHPCEFIQTDLFD